MPYGGYKRTYRRNYRRTYRRNYKRKRYGKKAYTRYPIITRYGSRGLPRAVFTKITYSERVQLSYTSPTVANYMYRLNNITDPNYTGLGGQPYMRDQLVALYSRYVVTGAKVKLYAATKTADIDSMVTMRATNSTAGAADFELEIERGAWKCVVSNESPKVCKTYYAINKMWGVTRNQVLTDDVFSASTSGGPSRESYLQLAMQSMDASTSSVVDCMIQITYYVKFYERIEQLPS